MLQQGSLGCFPFMLTFWIIKSQFLSFPAFEKTFLYLIPSPPLELSERVNKEVKFRSSRSNENECRRYKTPQESTKPQTKVFRTRANERGDGLL